MTAVKGSLTPSTFPDSRHHNNNNNNNDVPSSNGSRGSHAAGRQHQVPHIIGLHHHSPLAHHLPHGVMGHPRPPPLRLPLISHPHPFSDVNLVMPGGLIPLPPPPYSTLPSRSHHRRLIDSVINLNQSFVQNSESVNNNNTTTSSTPQTPESGNLVPTNVTSSCPPPLTPSAINSNNNSTCGNRTTASGAGNSSCQHPGPDSCERLSPAHLLTSSCVPSSSNGATAVMMNSCGGSQQPTQPSGSSALPSYHHLYSSSSPSSLRHRRRMMRQQRCIVPDSSSSSSYLSENKKYLVFVSLFVVGIVLTFIGVVMLSLFTISFGFTFILFSLLLYKLLPASKYAPRSMMGRSRASMALSPRPHHPYIVSTDPSVMQFALPPPPPSYQEALNSAQLIQSLDPVSLQHHFTTVSPNPASSSNNHCRSGGHRSQVNRNTCASSSGQQQQQQQQQQPNNNNNSVNSLTEEVTVTGNSLPATIVTIESNVPQSSSSSPCSSQSSPPHASRSHVTRVQNEQQADYSHRDHHFNSPPHNHQVSEVVPHVTISTVDGSVSSNNRPHFVTIIEATI